MQVAVELGADDSENLIELLTDASNSIRVALGTVHRHRSDEQVKAAAQTTVADACALARQFPEIGATSPSYSPGCRKEPGKLRVGVDARLRVAARLPRGVIGVVGAGGLREGLGRGDSGPAVYGPAGISAAAM